MELARARRTDVKESNVMTHAGRAVAATFKEVGAVVSVDRSARIPYGWTCWGDGTWPTGSPRI